MTHPIMRLITAAGLLVSLTLSHPVQAAGPNGSADFDQGIDAKAAVERIRMDAARTQIPQDEKFSPALHPEEMACEYIRFDRQSPTVRPPFSLQTAEYALHCPPRVRHNCYRERVAEYSREVTLEVAEAPPLPEGKFYAAAVCLVRNKLSAVSDSASARKLAFQITDDGKRAVVRILPADAEANKVGAASFMGRADRCYYTGMTEPRLDPETGRETGGKLCRYSCGDGDVAFMPPAVDVDSDTRSCLPFFDRGHLPR